MKRVTFAYNLQYMRTQNPTRHVCALCGKKRTQRYMAVVPVIEENANTGPGTFWACKQSARYQHIKPCIVRYLENKRDHFAHLLEKCASALNKLEKYK